MKYLSIFLAVASVHGLKKYGETCTQSVYNIKECEDGLTCDKASKQCRIALNKACCDSELCASPWKCTGKKGSQRCKKETKPKEPEHSSYQEIYDESTKY